tara:strand:+ start:708 stop:1079 length:372 start_codon:yes stop_codon:yes gene_type:complete
MTDEVRVSDSTAISMPVRNLLSIIAAVAVGVWAYFGIEQRLNIVETELQLMNADLLKAAEQKPIDQEQYMLLEFLSKEHDKLKTDVEDKLPMIDKVDMHSQFLEDRVIDLESLTDKLRGNGHD